MPELKLTPSQPVQQTQTKTRTGILWIRIVLGVLFGIALLVVAAVTGLPIVAKLFEIRSFHATSNSMCPTICTDERFLASMNAYRHAPPARGDVVLHRSPDGASLFIKRVVGIAGDTISSGAHNELLINGQKLEPPGICGKPSMDVQDSANISFFAVKVPSGQLFVLGDNLSNSYDSRSFGPIGVDQVRGKPLLVYWSRESSRIGCLVH